MLALKRTLVLSAALAVCFAAPAAGDDIVVNSPGWNIPASAIDQPRLSAVLTDGGTVITDGGKAVVFDAFADTGASGFVISNLSALGYPAAILTPEVPSLGLDGVPAGEFVGYFTETGVGGTELGDVTKSLGVMAINGEIGVVTGDNYAAYSGDFADYGEHALWVRRSAGAGEVIEVSGTLAATSPLNVIGMPVISQRVMVMDPTPTMAADIFSLGLIKTYLLPASDPGIPSTSITLATAMRDFTGATPLGETTPAQANNPVVLDVGVSYTPGGGGPANTVTGQEWLFDPGASSSFVGLQAAWDLGLIPDGMTIANFLVQHEAASGIVLQIGGIGDAVDAPLLTVDEIRIPIVGTGDDLVWQDVDILVVDVTGLAGVFGMNMLIPSLTLDIDMNDPLDYDDLLGLFDSISPGPFDTIVFDPFNDELRLNLIPEPATTLLLAFGGALLLRRRRRGSHSAR